jgi:hypothetical protein
MLIIAAMVLVLAGAAFFGVQLSHPIPQGSPTASPVPTPMGLPSKATLIPIPSPSFATTIATPAQSLQPLTPIPSAPQTLIPEPSDTPEPPPTPNENIPTVAPGQVDIPSAPAPPSPPSPPR